MSTNVKDLIVKLILSGIGMSSRIDGNDVRIAVEFIRSFIDGDRVVHKPLQDIASRLAGILDGDLNINSRTNVASISTGSRRITLSTSLGRREQSISINVGCLNRGGTLVLSSRAFIMEFLKSGVLRRGSITDYVVVDSDGLLRALNEVEAKYSDKIIMKIPECSFYFLKRGNSLVRLDKLGSSANNIQSSDQPKWEYLIVPRSILEQYELILGVNLGFIETNPDNPDSSKAMSSISLPCIVSIAPPQLPQENNKVKVKMSLRLYWIDSKTFIDPCMHYNVANAQPEEVSHYYVKPEDKVLLSGNLLELINKAERTRDNDVNKLDLLSNIFIIPYISKPEEVKPPSPHRELQNLLVKLGETLGFNAVIEYDIGGFRLDVAWLDGDELEYAFEVVIGGSVIEALYRLERSEARNKVLVVDDEKLNEVKTKANTDIKVISISSIISGKKAEVIRQILS
jgi:hypothetical protein